MKREYDIFEDGQRHHIESYMQGSNIAGEFASLISSTRFDPDFISESLCEEIESRKIDAQTGFLQKILRLTDKEKSRLGVLMLKALTCCVHQETNEFIGYTTTFRKALEAANMPLDIVMKNGKEKSE